MRIVIIVMMFVLMAQSSYAESMKERLRRARQQEIEALNPAPVVTETPAAENPPEKKPAVCDQTPKELDGEEYYFECYCRDKKYPDIELYVKKAGVTYEGVGIKEMGSDITHLKPEHRVKYRYTCGVSVGWQKDNPVQFKDAKECFAFADKIKQEVGKTVEVDVGPLYSGCGAHIHKVEKPKAM